MPRRQFLSVNVVTVWALSATGPSRVELLEACGGLNLGRIGIFRKVGQ
jgi:hypothetical protein